MKSNLLKRGYLSLIFTQFFGAANDNILKMVLTFMVIDGVWKGDLGEGGQGIVALCFTIPFILLSGYAGQFADRNSKQFVSVLVKVVEIPIAIVALAGFWWGNLWVTLGALVALTCQSAFFGPAKYGMIPELVAKDDLSRANGVINMMTNIAVIAGAILAGVISEKYAPTVDKETGLVASPLLWLPGAALLAMAVVGLGAVLFLPRLNPGDKGLKYDWNPLGTYIVSLKQMAATPLLMVALAWAYFYLLAGMALLIIPEYTLVLDISRVKASYILGVMAIAIGAGCVVAGLISGHRIKIKLVPIGAAGLSFFFILLGMIPPTFWNVCGFIIGAGFFAGFYIVPLQALLQKLAPEDERGRFLGTANGLSFSFLALSSLLYWVIRPAFQDEPQRIFLLSGALMILGTGFFLGLFYASTKAYDARTLDSLT